MISDGEWETLCLLIEEGWPGEFDDHAAKAWRVLLYEFDARQVFAAVWLLVSRGGTWRPSVAEVVAEVRRDPSRPTFAEVCQLVFGRGGVLRARTSVRKATWALGERERLDDEAALERAESLHPLIGAFVRSQGLDRLRAIDLEDPQWGEVNRKRLAEDWSEFCEVGENRELALAAGDRRAELGHFDPLARLRLGSGDDENLVDRETR